MALFIKKNGRLETLAGSSLDTIPCGTIIESVENTAPADFLPCDGTDTTGTANELSTHYPILYSLLGNSNVLPQKDWYDLGEQEIFVLSINDQNPTIIPDNGVFYIGLDAGDGDPVYLHKNNDTITLNASEEYEVKFCKNDSVYLQTHVGAQILYEKISYYNNPKTCYIKATASAPTGVDTNAWKQYMSNWVDVTSDWSVPYISAGTGSIYKALYRPSTKELKIIVDLGAQSVSGATTLSAVVAYAGSDVDILAMKDHPLEHTVSVQHTSIGSTNYSNGLVDGGIQIRTEENSVYFAIRNIFSSTAVKAYYALIHIVL